jgi:thioredoxin
MIEISSVEFKQKIENKETFLVDMYATWCGPCKVMIANLEEVDKHIDYNPRVGIYKYNVESDMEFSVKMGIKSVPTVKVYQNGGEVFSKSGVMSTDQIIKLLSEY